MEEEWETLRRKSMRSILASGYENTDEAAILVGTAVATFLTSSRGLLEEAWSSSSGGMAIGRLPRSGDQLPFAKWADRNIEIISISTYFGQNRLE